MSSENTEHPDKPAREAQDPVTNPPSPPSSGAHDTAAVSIGPVDGVVIVQEDNGSDADGIFAKEVAGAMVLIDPFTAEETTISPSSAQVPASMHIAEKDTDEEITEKLRRQGVRIGRGTIAPRVFWPALIVVALVALISIVLPDASSRAFHGIQDWIVTNLGWYYMLAVGGFVAFAAFIGLSRLGRIKLGADDEEPEFSRMSWFAMLFAAGMGIGLVFYGVAEPLMYATVDMKPGWDGDQNQILGMAMAQTFVHWGLHPWAVYAVIGLSLAYAIHRRGRPVSIRWALEPILGDRVKGWAGDLIDIIAIFGTVFGVATSLGLGVQQISAGLESMGVVDRADNTLLVVLIAAITFLATLSVVSGIGAGIRWLSNINLSMAGILVISMLLLGPTVFLLQNFVESLGFYLGNVLRMTFDVGAFERTPEAASWFSGWTIFYWGWWIAWAPFVGVFIARISRGRTVREFVAGVLLVPSIVGFLWFSIMGGSGLYRQFFGEGDLVQDGEVSAEGALFQVLEGLPLGTIFSVVAIILVAVFFITSSDSGSLVIDMLASGGHPNPPTWSRVLWSTLEGLVAIALLLAGGLQALQAAALATALPFSVILILMAVATFRALRLETQILGHSESMRRLERLTGHVQHELVETLPDSDELQKFVDTRIDYRLSRTRGGIRPPGLRSSGPRRREDREQKQ